MKILCLYVLEFEFKSIISLVISKNWAKSKERWIFGRNRCTMHGPIAVFVLNKLTWMSTHLRVHICVSSNIRKTKANFYRSPYLTQKHKLLWQRQSLRRLRLKSSMQNLEKWHEINHLDSQASFDKWSNTHFPVFNEIL